MFSIYGVAFAAIVGLTLIVLVYMMRPRRFRAELAHGELKTVVDIDATGDPGEREPATKHEGK